MVIAKHFINGEWVEGRQELRENTNPAGGKVLGKYYSGKAPFAEVAINEARRVLDEKIWATFPRLRASALFELNGFLETQHVYLEAGNIA